MCPFCITTAVAVTAGATSSAGAAAAIALRWRALRLWLVGKIDCARVSKT